MMTKKIVTEKRLVVGFIVLLIILFGIRGITIYGDNQYQKGIDFGATLVYNQMNEDCIEQFQVYYNIEKRKFYPVYETEE